ncbi:hypothetical protein [Gordonia sp. FQ]|uniref:hypothetical protein n=1 Tax=Gordonia sp. FQ TaxID=3446634 RepID=UPI003F83230B
MTYVNPAMGQMAPAPALDAPYARILRPDAIAVLSEPALVELSRSATRMTTRRPLIMVAVMVPLIVLMITLPDLGTASGLVGLIGGLIMAAIVLGVFFVGVNRRRERALMDIATAGVRAPEYRYEAAFTPHFADIAVVGSRIVRIYYTTLTRANVRDGVVLLYCRDLFYFLPRELFDDTRLDHLRACGVRVTVR